MQLIDIIKQRSSYYDYCNKEIMSDEVIHQLIALTTLAPTAYNLQNWEFIAVKSVEKKEELYQASYRQQKIKDASVTFVVCGDVHGFNNLKNALQPSLDAQQINQSQVDGWLRAVNQTHQDNLQLQRDEAFRSASLSSMMLMLVAEDQGYATGAMSGFETEKVQSAMGLPEHIVPVMLITVGKPTSERPAQKKRYDVERVLSIL